MKTLNAVALAIALAVPILASGEGLEIYPADGLSKPLIQRQYERIAPSMCLLSYTTEITNPNTGQVSQRESNALGLIVSEDGLVLAHGHMHLENRQPRNIRVTVNLLGDRDNYPAVMLRKPEDVNICLLRIEPGGSDVTFTPAEFNTNATQAMGDPLMILGLLSESLDHVPSAISRRIGAVLPEPRMTYTIDEVVPFGFVGGPVVNVAGELIGVVGFDLSDSEGGELYTRSGHPLVYQARLFERYIQRPPGEDRIDGDEEDAWLGVFTQPLTDDLAEYWGLPMEGGVVVSTVVPDSPAEEAGLLMGDVIFSFNDTPIDAKHDRDVSAFTKLVRETPMGQEIPLQLYRDGEVVDLALVLTERPKSARDAEEYEDDVFGLTVRELTADVRILLNLPDNLQGVLIRKVKSGSAAQLAGIPPNALLLALNNVPVTSIDEYTDAVEQLSEQEPVEIAVLVRAGARTGFFRMQPRWDE